jgi:hypothetical protein
MGGKVVKLHEGPQNAREAIEEALAYADEFDAVVFIGQYKRDDGYRVIAPDPQRLADTNWLVDVLKSWLLQR